MQPCGHYISMEKSELLRSQDELLAVLRLAGMELRKRSIAGKLALCFDLCAGFLAKAELAATSKTKQAPAAGIGFFQGANGDLGIDRSDIKETIASRCKSILLWPSKK